MGRFLVAVEVDTAEWEGEQGKALSSVDVWDHYAATLAVADDKFVSRVVAVVAGAAAERVIAATRAAVLEGLGYGPVADSLREGTSPGDLAALVEPGSEAESKILPLLQRWAEEDAREGGR
jgi:hypothetical protein